MTEHWEHWVLPFWCYLASPAKSKQKISGSVFLLIYFVLRSWDSLVSLAASFFFWSRHVAWQKRLLGRLMRYLRSSVVEAVKNFARTPLPLDVYAKIVMLYSVNLVKFFSSVAVVLAETFFVLRVSSLADFLYMIRYPRIMPFWWFAGTGRQWMNRLVEVELSLATVRFCGGFEGTRDSKQTSRLIRNKQ